MNMMRSMTCVMLAAMLTALTGCCTNQSQREARVNPWRDVAQLVAVLQPTPGHSAHGIVRFFSVPDGVRIIADIDGVEPNSTHAFHVHEFGDMTKADATSAGPHYNPAGQPHGKPTDTHRHAGDFGNVTADAHGHIHLDRVDHDISLVGPQFVWRPASHAVRKLGMAGANHAIIGRAVVLHASADKFTQPAGDAGARIAIGVIGVANPKLSPYKEGVH